MDQPWNIGHNHAEETRTCQVKDLTERKSKDEAKIDPMESLFRLFLLLVDSGALGLQVFLSDERKEESHLEELMRVDPLSEVSAEVSHAHEKEGFWMHEDPWLGVDGWVESLPEKDTCNRQITGQQDL